VRGRAVRRNDVIDRSLNARRPEAPLDAQLASFGRLRPKAGKRERPHSGVGLISIQIVQAVAYSFFVGKLSNPAILVRLGADSRHVAD
jgi:hypothetical protein